MKKVSKYLPDSFGDNHDFYNTKQQDFLVKMFISIFTVHMIKFLQFKVWHCSKGLSKIILQNHSTKLNYIIELPVPTESHIQSFNIGAEFSSVVSSI